MWLYGFYCVGLLGVVLVLVLINHALVKLHETAVKILEELQREEQPVAWEHTVVGIDENGYTMNLRTREEE